MRIVGPPSATLGSVLRALPSATTVLFRDTMVPALWTVAVDHSIDPVGVIAQSYKETGGGSFTGRVKPWFNNPCGLKVRNLDDVMVLLGTADVDHGLCHAQFPSWEVGATAMVQHLCAYANWDREGYAINVDPRYDWVVDKFKLENWSELGGKWAPSVTYGDEIETMMRDLQRG